MKTECFGRHVSYWAIDVRSRLKLFILICVWRNESEQITRPDDRRQAAISIKNNILFREQRSNGNYRFIFYWVGDAECFVSHSACIYIFSKNFEEAINTIFIYINAPERFSFLPRNTQSEICLMFATFQANDEQNFNYGQKIIGLHIYAEPGSKAYTVYLKNCCYSQNVALVWSEINRTSLEMGF